MTTLLHPFTNENKLATVSLASIFAIRMLGMFMVLPVLAIAIDQFPSATPKLMGMALGIYGLTQATLQVPFGMLSDRVGRKPVIAFGLGLFALGSILAAMSHSIYGIILGRSLQGSGAIGSTIMALVADLTPEDKRTYAMAIIGLFIGASFGIAMILGPVINDYAGVHGIFWFTTILALLGILILYKTVPTPEQEVSHRDTDMMAASFHTNIYDSELRRLDFGVFTLHAMLAALFLIIPKIFVAAGLEPHNHWHIYIPALVGALFIMVPGAIMAEKHQKMRQVIISAVILLNLCIGSLWFFPSSYAVLCAIMLCFFGSFGLLEASLPSLVSKIAPANAKGTAMGIYSTSQFLGVFFGGSVGGTMLATYGNAGIFYVCLGLGILWMLLALTMKEPRYLSTIMINLGIHDHHCAEQLEMYLAVLPGIYQAQVMVDDGIAYLKIDSKITSLERVASVTEVWLKQYQSKWETINGQGHQ